MSKTTTQSLSPAQQQYLKFRQTHPGYVLFFRMGDFYELFWEDARLAAKVLGVTLVTRNNAGDESIPMAGIPVHSVEGCLRKMIAAGHKVAICEQAEKSKKHQVIQMMTPGETPPLTLPCGHSADNFNHNVGCLACDAGALTPAEEAEKLESLRQKNLAIVENGMVKEASLATVHNQDCIAGMAEKIPSDRISLTVTSIPFEELFTYSGKIEDVGNNGSTVDIRAGRFALNMRFCIEQLFRVTAPGCNACIHIQQLLAYKNQHGFMGRRDFRGAIVDLFRAGGFHFEGEFVIPKDPQAMAQRLSLHSLQFKTGYGRNACNLAPAVNDYVLIFQKPGEAANPVRSIYHKERNPTGWVTTEEWIKWASGVWDDIDEFDILDGARSARESTEEKHVCPLQLIVIRRLVRLYTNPASMQSDVLVLDPFMGIGSTAHECILLGRNAVGFELKESYHANALKNIKRAISKVTSAEVRTPSLFEMAGVA